MLVAEAEKLWGAGGVEAAAAVFEGGEDGGVAKEGGGVGGGEGGGEAMEDGVIGVEDLRRGSEGRGVPVVVRGENGRLGLSVDSEDVGLFGEIRGFRLNLRNKRY
eukprot:TRINITY_DN3076_c0_g1_i1.p5 TRINITY_DN3076_c0_g1~~TRINITY_DN3076_c0_g1_i1.p5  ORF type:complete len:105 (+),score=24.42 TRINITY_DN3076_c0_g1_i1:2818-3132(+)